MKKQEYPESPQCREKTPCQIAPEPFGYADKRYPARLRASSCEGRGKPASELRTQSDGQARYSLNKAIPRQSARLLAGVRRNNQGGTAIDSSLNFRGVFYFFTGKELAEEPQ
ncbi:hypothetical protein [Cohnella sp. OV330]|uniref:hypothetical protein n=1 Tax=Cohnella sp. OV330 TaxID=1855288 RepID=UPI000B7CAEAC|nr:hypothetical protein [Cohnella sp. OV330]